jgi:hypothetical protein
MTDHEILLLTYERLLEGVLFLREVVFASDHQVYSRVSWMVEAEEGFQSHGWRQVVNSQGGAATWSTEEVLQSVARRAAAKGWQVQWHPRQSPSQQG